MSSYFNIVVVQSLSCVQLFATSWTVACQASLSFTISWSLLKRHVHWVGDTIQSSHPLSSPSAPTFNLSQHQGLFQRVSSHQVTKVLELQHQSSEYSGLISFMIDWFDLLAFQGTLKSLQHHSSKASILRHSAFSIVQLSHPCMPTRKTIALIIALIVTFVGKAMSLLFNTLPKFVIAFFPGSKSLSISWGPPFFFVSW